MQRRRQIAKLDKTKNKNTNNGKHKYQLKKAYFLLALKVIKYQKIKKLNIKNNVCKETLTIHLKIPNISM